MATGIAREGRARVRQTVKFLREIFFAIFVNQGRVAVVDGRSGARDGYLGLFHDPVENSRHAPNLIGRHLQKTKVGRVVNAEAGDHVTPFPFSAVFETVAFIGRKSAHAQRVVAPPIEDFAVARERGSAITLET